MLISSCSLNESQDHSRDIVRVRDLQTCCQHTSASHGRGIALQPMPRSFGGLTLTGHDDDEPSPIDPAISAAINHQGCSFTLWNEDIDHEDLCNSVGGRFGPCFLGLERW